MPDRADADVIERFVGLLGARRTGRSALAIRLRMEGGIAGREAEVIVADGRYTVRERGQQPVSGRLARSELDQLVEQAGAALGAPDPIRGRGIVHDGMRHVLEVAMDGRRRSFDVRTGDEASGSIWALVRTLTELAHR